ERDRGASSGVDVVLEVQLGPGVEARPLCGALRQRASTEDEKGARPADGPHARVDARGVVAEAEAEQHLRLDAARPLLPLGAPFAGAVGEAIAADPLEGQQEIRPTEAVEGVGDPAEDRKSVG